ncbi:solute carrier family 66 member 2-like [Gastrophryne carolinensis]
METPAGALLSWASSCVMVVGGVLPYVPQYRQIRRTGSAEGFSTRVCLVLLVANILRVFFWWGRSFEVALLLQSVLMIGAMLAMLQLCCSVQSESHVSTKQRYFTDFRASSFWRWNCFEDYLQFCACLTLCAAILTYLLLGVAIYVEGLGLLALMTEATLGLPQLLQNRRNQSTRGMSLQMVLLWTAGDCFKTAYFILKETPVQFWVCGAVQIALDAAILSQVHYYNQQSLAKLG